MMPRSRVTVCSRLRVARGPVSSTERPASMSSWTLATISRRPYFSTVRSRNAMTSSKFSPVSTCMTGKGTGAGQKALTARCSMTTESLPPENSSAGFSIVAATSRKMWTASDSSLSRCVSS